MHTTHRLQEQTTSNACKRPTTTASALTLDQSDPLAAQDMPRPSAQMTTTPQTPLMPQRLEILHTTQWVALRRATQCKPGQGWWIWQILEGRGGQGWLRLVSKGGEGSRSGAQAGSIPAHCRRTQICAPLVLSSSSTREHNELEPDLAKRTEKMRRSLRISHGLSKGSARAVTFEGHRQRDDGA